MMDGISPTCNGNFNSQPHKEADYSEKKISLAENAFQLTASQGG